MPNRVSRSIARVEPRLLVAQRVDRQIEHRHLHPAGDVDADRVRDDGVRRSPARRRSAGRSRRARPASARRPPPPAAGRRSSSAASARRARGSSPQIRYGASRSRQERPRRGVIEQLLRQLPVRSSSRNAAGDAATRRRSSRTVGHARASRHSRPAESAWPLGARPAGMPISTRSRVFMSLFLSLSIRRSPDERRRLVLDGDRHVEEPPNDVGVRHACAPSASACGTCRRRPAPSG